MKFDTVKRDCRIDISSDSLCFNLRVVIANRSRMSRNLERVCCAWLGARTSRLVAILFFGRRTVPRRVHRGCFLYLTSTAAPFDGRRAWDIATDHSSSPSYTPPTLALLVNRCQLPAEDLVAAEAGSVFGCLNPVHATVEEQLASATSSGDVVDSPITVKTCARDGERRRGDGGNRLLHEEADATARGGRLRVHAAWVKAGHDVLHERDSFLLSLLHKVCSVYVVNGTYPC